MHTSLVSLVENGTIRTIIGSCDYCLVVALPCTCEAIHTAARLETSSFLSAILHLPLSPTDSEVLDNLAVEHEIYDNDDENDRCYWELLSEAEDDRWYWEHVYYLDSQDDSVALLEPGRTRSP